MSRIGKQPIAIPAGVEVTLKGQDIAVKGAKGTLSFSVPQNVEAKVADKKIVFTPRSKSKLAVAQWGMSRATVANFVEGVTKGFERKLNLVGVGYRAAVQGKNLTFTVGYSHPVSMDIPQGIEVKVNDNTEVVIHGFDKHKVGQFAANVRAKREPEPFKGKGIRYTGERIMMKEGKKK